MSSCWCFPAWTSERLLASRQIFHTDAEDSGERESGGQFDFQAIAEIVFKHGDEGLHNASLGGKRALREPSRFTQPCQSFAKRFMHVCAPPASKHSQKIFFTQEIFHLRDNH